MLRKKINTARSLSQLSWRTFVSGLLHVPMAGILLRLGGFKFARSFYDRPSHAPGPSVLRAQKLKEIDRGFSLAVKYSPHRGTCLSRSLVLQWLLQKNGVPSTLSIGVRQNAHDSFIAHAWVESPDGYPSMGRRISANFSKILK